jgi:hypothetical protein
MTELEKINDNKTDHLNSNTKDLLKAISTSAELWAILKKQQSMPDGAVLQCWIITD